MTRLTKLITDKFRPQEERFHIHTCVCTSMIEERSWTRNNNGGVNGRINSGRYFRAKSRNHIENPFAANFRQRAVLIKLCRGPIEGHRYRSSSLGTRGFPLQLGEPRETISHTHTHTHTHTLFSVLFLNYNRIKTIQGEREREREEKKKRRGGEK